MLYRPWMSKPPGLKTYVDLHPDGMKVYTYLYSDIGKPGLTVRCIFTGHNRSLEANAAKMFMDFQKDVLMQPIESASRAARRESFLRCS